MLLFRVKRVPLLKRAFFRSFSEQPISLPEVQAAKQFLHDKNYQKAVPQLERASTIASHIFGPTDSMSLSIVEATADALTHQGQFTQASKKIETLVGLYQKKQDHVSVLRMMENLILCHQKRAAFPSAVESSIKMTKWVNEAELEKPVQDRYRARSMIHHGFNLACQGQTTETSRLFQGAAELSSAHEPTQALALYHLGRFQHFQNSEFDAAMECYHKAETLLKSVQSTDQEEANILLIMVYNGLLETLVGLQQYQDADKYGKSSLDISNNLTEKNTCLVEWTLHLMAQVMLALQQYFYAEGLFRKLDHIIDQNHDLKRPLYEVQVRTLSAYKELMERFKRSGDVKFLNEKMETYQKEQEVHPDIYMHAHFQDFKFVRLA